MIRALHASDAIDNASYAHSLLPLVSHLAGVNALRGRVGAERHQARLSSCPSPPPPPPPAARARFLVSGRRGERVNLEIQPPPN